MSKAQSNISSNPKPEKLMAWQLAGKKTDAAILMEKALAAHQQHDFVNARRYYEEILQQQPDYADVWNLLGTIHFQEKDFDAAEELVKKAIGLNNDTANFHNNLGAILKAQTKLDEAIKSFERSISLQPYNWEGFANIGKIFMETGDMARAEQYFLKAAEVNSKHLGIWRDLAATQEYQRKFEEAEKSYDECLKLAPEDPILLNNAATVLEANGKLEEAIELCEKAFKINPNIPEIARNYGFILQTLKRFQDAANIAYRKALENNPTWLPGYVDYIQSLLFADEVDKAYLYYKTMETLPDFDKDKPHPMSYKVLRNCCAYDELEDLEPKRFDAMDALPAEALTGMMLSELPLAESDDDYKKLLHQHRRWAEYYENKAAANPLGKIEKKRPRKNRKIRIGILSSDLRLHAVSRFLFPVLKNLNKDEFELYCYSPLRELPHDPIQKDIREMSQRFEFMQHKTDKQVAELIQGDELDILFELNGHTMDTRCFVLGYRLAPTQISWLGYPFSLQLKNLDYILADRYFAPEDPNSISEDTIIMPRNYAPYMFDDEEVEFDPTPAFERNGYVTFGTFSNIYKYRPGQISCWAECLNQVKNSKMVFVRPEAHSLLLQENLANEFGRYGVDKDRLVFVQNVPGQHFKYYNMLDMSLDVFPLVGGTTTCDSLRMSVPVITRYGPYLHQRLGYSLVSNAGLPELCAGTPEQFVNIAANLAETPDLMRFLRKNLQEIIRTSPLSDAEQFTRDFEEAMRQVVKLRGSN
ncbi:MAG: tetratricopeptide repeat protein [Dongiaceae bacterium]